MKVVNKLIPVFALVAVVVALSPVGLDRTLAGQSPEPLPIATGQVQNLNHVGFAAIQLLHRRGPV